MPTPRYPIELPRRVARAYEVAESIGFGADGGVSSCLPGVGRVLAALAAAHRGGRIAELGTAVGAGAAWLASGMDAAATLVTAEIDAERAELARKVLAGDDRVTVITGHWADHLPSLAPFDLVFLDGGYEEHVGADARVSELVVDLVGIGGQLVLDDLTAQADLGDDDLARTDFKRELGLRDDRFVGAEFYVPSTAGAVGGIRTGGLIMTRVR
ncbi:MAG: O-methyltransferase [Acidimicrobiales bacterium]